MVKTATETGYVTVNNAKLYYEVAGEGQPVILGHAGFVDSGMWDAQWEALATRYKVIRYDMRGYGKSDLAPSPVSRRDELSGVMKALDIDRAALIGCSLSGETMLDFALEHPDRVDALILVSAVPGGFEMEGEPPALLFEMFGAMQAGDVERTSELQIRLWVDGMYRQPEQVVSAVRERAAEMNLIAVKNGTFATADSEPLNPLNPPAVGRLNEIGVPTLVIAGALDHPEILRAADVMAAAIPNAQKVIIPDSAHVPNMEKPAEFNAVVLSLLEKLG